jgi:hypothetical protein
MKNKWLISVMVLSLTVVFYSKVDAKGRMAGNMGSGMMGMCPNNSLENVKTNITETADGVTITYSAKDKKDIIRLQKMAKMHKLAEELNEEETQIK